MKEHREQAFAEDGTQTLRQALSELLPNERIFLDFVNVCLTQLIAEPMETGAFVTNLTEENQAMLGVVEDL